MEKIETSAVMCHLKRSKKARSKTKKKVRKDKLETQQKMNSENVNKLEVL